MSMASTHPRSRYLKEQKLEEVREDEGKDNVAEVFATELRERTMHGGKGTDPIDAGLPIIHCSAEVGTADLAFNFRNFDIVEALCCLKPSAPVRKICIDIGNRASMVDRA